MAKKFNRREILTGVSSAAATLGMPSIVAAQTPLVMKLGTATINDGQVEWLKRFAAAVEEKSGGKIKGEVYPGSQLGQIPRMIEGVQFGQIQGFIGPAEFLAGADSRYEVLSSPGVFKDLNHAERVLGGNTEFRSAFMALGANKGFKAVDLMPYSLYSFATRKPIKTIDDFKGLKIRVLAASLQLEQVRRLGGTAVPMALGEVLPALQQGAIDGVMSTLAVSTPLRLYDAAKYDLETGHGVTCNIVVMSKLWFDKLPADLQTIVTTAGNETGRGIFAWQQEFNGKQEGIWNEKGGEVSRLSPDEQARFLKTIETVAESVLKDKPDVKAMYDILLASAKKAA